MLKTKALEFAYHPEQHFSFPDIDLGESDDLLILGESGIGKTTLLHLIAGLLPPKTGSIELLGTQLEQLSPRQTDQFRGQHIGMVFQRPHFVQSLSLEENLALAQHLSTRGADRDRILQVSSDLGIKTKLAQKTHQLSQGEQQRAAIAMALVHKPKLLLADEPTANLDDQNCLKVIRLLKEQAAKTATSLLIITHDQRLKDQFQNQIAL